MLRWSNLARGQHVAWRGVIKLHKENKGASISAHLHRCESFAVGKTTAAAFDALHMHQT